MKKGMSKEYFTNLTQPGINFTRMIPYVCVANKINY